jgi:hypothetical protein
VILVIVLTTSQEVLLSFEGMELVLL